MATPRCLCFGNAAHPVLWVVDDAWFEGYDPREPALRGAPAICALLDFATDGTSSGEIPVSDLVSRTGHVKADPNYSDKYPLPVRYDLENLETIASLCGKYSLRLTLANFEYLERHFSEVNRQRSALLLDVGYMASASADAERNRYGAELLANVLRNRLLLVDAAFFTSDDRATKMQAEFRQLVESGFQWGELKPKDAWPLLRMPVVIKDKAVKARLDAFCEYFSALHGKLRLELVADSALAAHSIKRGHPDKPEEARGVLLEDWYQDLNGKTQEETLESFKALYYYEPDTTHGFGTRNCHVECFVKHLEWAGVRTTLGHGVTLGTVFRLPVQPGIRFLVPLLGLLETCATPELEISIRKPSTGLRATAEVAIRMDGIEAFEAAFLTDGGASVKLLRRLIFCDKAMVYEYASEKARAQALAEEVWVHPAPLRNAAGSRDLYAPLVRPTFDLETKKLRLKWEFIPNAGS